MNRNLILYIAMSLDGFIAKKDDNIDFLSIVETPNEDFGFADFQQNIDTVIWGRKTFDKVLSFGNGVPYKDKGFCHFQNKEGYRRTCTLFRQRR